MSLRDQLTEIKEKGLADIEQTEDLTALNEIRVHLLGKKGPITAALRGIKDLTPEERPEVGSYANKIRDAITQAVSDHRQTLEDQALNEQLAAEKIDVTMPGKPVVQGQPHVIQQIIDQIVDLFLGMGYEVLSGPEVEEDKYNFEMMNLPKDHPARDMQDTFYLSKDILMRTQTSAMQARALEKHDFSKGPLKMISPGIVYRRDTDDPTHSHQFHQVEGLVIDEHLSLIHI